MVVSKQTVPTTFTEQVEVLKGQLGLSGTMAEVVHQAAKQLGVEAGGRPLVEVSRECARACGAPASRRRSCYLQPASWVLRRGQCSSGWRCRRREAPLGATQGI